MTDLNHPTYGPLEVTMLANCAKQFRHYEQNHLAKVNTWEKEKAGLNVRFKEDEAKFNEIDAKIQDTMRKAFVNEQLALQIEAFLAEYDLNRVERIARTCHEAIRAYDQTLGSFSIKPWDEAPDWQRDSAINGVLFHLTNPDAGDEASHENWMREKLSTGWTLGPEKNEELKTHHLLIPFNELPKEQQFKDTLFRTIVHAASKG